MQSSQCISHSVRLFSAFHVDIRVRDIREKHLQLLWRGERSYKHFLLLPAHRRAAFLHDGFLQVLPDSPGGLPGLAAFALDENGLSALSSLDGLPRKVLQMVAFFSPAFISSDTLKTLPPVFTLSFVYSTDHMPKDRLRPLYYVSPLHRIDA